MFKNLNWHGNVQKEAMTEIKLVGYSIVFVYYVYKGNDSNWYVGITIGNHQERLSANSLEHGMKLAENHYQNMMTKFFNAFENMKASTNSITLT